jgi:hypothetical protein
MEMVLSADTKWVVLPEELVNRAREVAIKQGVSLTDFATEALEQAVKVVGWGASLKEVTTLFNIHEVMRASGVIQIQRSNFNEMLQESYEKDKEKLLADWRIAGRWYGEYLRAVFRDEVLDHLEKVLLVSWNLNEVEVVEEDYTVKISFTSFTMSSEFTELLIDFISGLMTALGYKAEEVDVVKGLAALTYKMIIGG